MKNLIAFGLLFATLLTGWYGFSKTENLTERPPDCDCEVYSPGQPGVPGVLVCGECLAFTCWDPWGEI